MKERLVVEMSQAIDAPLESVSLIIREMTEARFGIGGKRAMKDGHLEAVAKLVKERL